MEGISTGGGGSVGGNVGNGGDFVGRDVVNHYGRDVQPSDYFRDELRELRERIKIIETFLAGTAVGQPGLTAQFSDALHRIERVEQLANLFDGMNKRIGRLEQMLIVIMSSVVILSIISLVSLNR